MADHVVDRASKAPFRLCWRPCVRRETGWRREQLLSASENQAYATVLRLLEVFSIEETLVWLTHTRFLHSDAVVMIEAELERGKACHRRHGSSMQSDVHQPIPSTDVSYRRFAWLLLPEPKVGSSQPINACNVRTTFRSPSLTSPAAAHPCHPIIVWLHGCQPCYLCLHRGLSRPAVSYSIKLQHKDIVEDKARISQNAAHRCCASGLHADPA